MEPHELQQHSAAMEADQVYRTALGDRLVELLRSIRQLLNAEPNLPLSNTTAGNGSSSSNSASPKQEAADSNHSTKHPGQGSAPSTSRIATPKTGCTGQLHPHPCLQQQQQAGVQQEGVGAVSGGHHAWSADLMQLLDDLGRVLRSVPPERPHIGVVLHQHLEPGAAEPDGGAVLPWVPQPVIMSTSMYTFHL